MAPAYGCGMVIVAMPQPFDFEHTTERFRGFGPDLANLWHEGGLHRVVGGREVRIQAAPAGVDVEPLEDEDTESPDLSASEEALALFRAAR